MLPMPEKGEESLLLNDVRCHISINHKVAESSLSFDKSGVTQLCKQVIAKLLRFV